ncbi:hypothetical protein QN277_011604 [Acacia crassicarpa]|uniref:Uncharacterized protein n=1 Tax=Acacia crassicarpa TaxID=499986 RepID=A0AAE1TBX3_9FABA|nr:hypothetical protein QN277_011604 [Acacia crassicarpa]
MLMNQRGRKRRRLHRREGAVAAIINREGGNRTRTERFLQLSPEAEVSPMSQVNDLEPVSFEIGAGCLTYESE